MEFDGKVVIVTGSTSGIGKQVAVEFAKNGAKVVICGRDEARMKSVIETCTQISPTKQTPLAVLADIRNDDELKKIIDTTVATFKKIDVLVNNAGMCEFVAVDDPKLTANFDETIRTNLRPMVSLSSLVIPYLIESKGNIVNISSTGAIKPHEGIAMYCAADAAKDMVTRSMALELGKKGVRVNCVRPGYVKTPIYALCGRVFEETDAFKKQPLEKVGLPEDIAHCVLFLASSKSSFITGALLTSDGGIIDA